MRRPGSLSLNYDISRRLWNHWKQNPLMLSYWSVLADTELLAPALPDTELVSSKLGLKVVVIATVVDISGVAARLSLGVAVKLTLGIAVRLRLGVAVKVLVKFLIKFLLNDFIADTIILVYPKTGRIPIKAGLKLVPLPIFIPPCIIIICVFNLA